MFLEFPEIEDSKIDTVKLLEASKDVVHLIEKFGVAFYLITSQITNQVAKIYEVYYKNPTENKYIQDLILKEKDTKEKIATVETLWLRRGIHLTLRLLELAEEDLKKNGSENQSEDISDILMQAYKEVLEPHHDWVARKGFKVICCMCPERSYVIDVISEGKGLEYLKKQSPEIIRRMRGCVENLIEFYETNKLEQ